jgi:hypothetical protein
VANTAMMLVPAKNRPRKSFEPRDFYQFGDPEDANRPPAAAGAAMLALIERRLFPMFALFVHDQLRSAGKDQSLPPRLAWMAEDATLLAPYPLEDGRWGGFLITQDTAAGKAREFRSENGERITLVVPAKIAAKGAEVAEAQAILAPPGSPP